MRHDRRATNVKNDALYIMPSRTDGWLELQIGTGLDPTRHSANTKKTTTADRNQEAVAYAWQDYILVEARA